MQLAWPPVILAGFLSCCLDHAFRKQIYLCPFVLVSIDSKTSAVILLLLPLLFLLIIICLKKFSPFPKFSPSLSQLLILLFSSVNTPRSSDWFQFVVKSTHRYLLGQISPGSLHQSILDVCHFCPGCPIPILSTGVLLSLTCIHLQKSSRFGSLSEILVNTTFVGRAYSGSFAGLTGDGMGRSEGLVVLSTRPRWDVVCRAISAGAVADPPT